MKLTSVRIKNYRSIGEVLIEFNPTCRILVGINESGKTNILDALALLSPTKVPDKIADIREPINQKPIEESYVEFDFSFDDDELAKALNELVSNSLSNLHQENVAIKDEDIVTNYQNGSNLEGIFSALTHGTYRVDIYNEENKWLFGDGLDDYSVEEGWYRPSDTCPPEIVVQSVEPARELRTFKLVKGNSSFTEHLVDLDTTYLRRLIREEIVGALKASLPRVIYWVYDEKNIMPNKVNIEEFANNPDSCVPLKNMFTLYKVTDIKKTIEDERKRGENPFRNFLNGVASVATNHFQKVWPDCKNIEFSLHENGDFIIPGIKEENIRDFAKRSDGFKRFVTFLLLISVNVQTNDLKDALLLIDEPDLGLHPSGSRYLRDELLEISKTNLVVYSTHSIFMIDRRNIGRHYIVKKEKELTQLDLVDDSNFIDEEVLYNSLGWSAFSIFTELNIIFEGWRDKHLFKLALSTRPIKVKKAFKNVRTSHIQGVKSVKTFAPMMELSGRRYLFVSDCDTPALEKQKLFIKDRHYGTWLNYKELDDTCTAITGEDFLKKEFLLEIANELLKQRGLGDFKEGDINLNKGILGSLKLWLEQEHKLQPKDVTEFIDEYKDELFKKLKPTNVDPAYSRVIDEIERKLAAL